MVGRTADWLGKVENDRAALDRLSVIRSLADALGVSVLDLIGEAKSGGPPPEQDVGVSRLRSALTDYRSLVPLAPVVRQGGEPPDLLQIRHDVESVMDAYQRSSYKRMLRSLPDLLSRTHIAAREYEGQKLLVAERFLALTAQAAAMVLTKLGEVDLAWIAAERGLQAAQRSGDMAVIGSLLRSGVHSLHSYGQGPTSTEMAGQAAGYLRKEMDWSSPRMISVYGTLLLPGAIAAAREGDRGSARDYLEESEKAALRLGRDRNDLWTAFGQTNVAVHRAAVANALGDVDTAIDLGRRIDTSVLPTERQVRHALELASAYVKRNRIDSALGQILGAEKLSSEQIRRHVMSRQIVTAMLETKSGKRNPTLAALALRMRII
ncbi:helix-turn-helix transcriptional regulator [Spinactinospora alkalitolerans]